VALSTSADDIGPLWAVLIYRALSVAVLLPLALARGVAALPAPVRKPMIVAGLCDIVGFTALAYGLERGPVAIVSVVAAQFATIAVVLGAKVLGERMRPHQWVGVALVLASVSFIALAR
jgi:drug/metabolite transporter (DMT)-like permease